MFTIIRIGRDLLSVVVGTALLLAAGITANGLLLMAWRRIEQLVAVRTTPLVHSGVFALPRS
jgi:hypothetical protein